MVCQTANEVAEKASKFQKGTIIMSSLVNISFGRCSKEQSFVHLFYNSTIETILPLAAKLISCQKTIVHCNINKKAVTVDNSPVYMMGTGNCGLLGFRGLMSTDYTPPTQGVCSDIMLHYPRLRNMRACVDEQIRTLLL